jgi:hypothetical protein
MKTRSLLSSMANRLNKTKICPRLSFHFDKSDLKNYPILHHTKEYHIFHQANTMMANCFLVRAQQITSEQLIGI